MENGKVPLEVALEMSLGKKFGLVGIHVSKRKLFKFFAKTEVLLNDVLNVIRVISKN